MCFTTLLSFSQVRIVNTTTNSAAVNSSAFMDVSSNTDINSSTNIGKGSRPQRPRHCSRQMCSTLWRGMKLQLSTLSRVASWKAADGATVFTSPLRPRKVCARKTCSRHAAGTPLMYEYWANTMLTRQSLAWHHTGAKHHRNAYFIEMQQALSTYTCAAKTLVSKTKMLSNIEITSFREMHKSLSTYACAAVDVILSGILWALWGYLSLPRGHLGPCRGHIGGTLRSLGGYLGPPWECRWGFMV